MSEEILVVKNLTKRFGGLTAIDGVSFSVKQAECLGLIGPNGAGKTTLFSLISGFLRPDSGEIYFKGKNITGIKPHKLVSMGLTRTFQLIKVFSNLTVRENLCIPGMAHSKDYERIAEDVAKKIHLEAYLDTQAKNLSHGDLKKLSIGIALATKPELILLDEPFAGLNPEEIIELDKIIEELKKDGVTQIIIEHRLRELFNLADRVIVLNFGKTIFEGSPEEVVRDIRVIEAYLGKKGESNA